VCVKKKKTRTKIYDYLLQSWLSILIGKGVCVKKNKKKDAHQDLRLPTSFVAQYPHRVGELFMVAFV